MRARRYKIACLAGDGIGPELMAEASRAVGAVSRLHGFSVEEAHVPFGGGAVRRFGRPLPPATRAACREADAVLIAATREPALEGVKADLDLTWRVTRVRLAREGDIALVSPVAEDAEQVAVERAFRLAGRGGRRAGPPRAGLPACPGGAGRGCPRPDGAGVVRSRPCRDRAPCRRNR